MCDGTYGSCVSRARSFKIVDDAPQFFLLRASSSFFSVSVFFVTVSTTLFLRRQCHQGMRVATCTHADKRPHTKRARPRQPGPEPNPASTFKQQCHLRFVQSLVNRLTKHGRAGAEETPENRWRSFGANTNGHPNIGGHTSPHLP